MQAYCGSFRRCPPPPQSLVLSTNSWVGGKNDFLGVMFLIIGSLALATAFAFVLAYHAGLVRRRKFGDTSQLSWNRKLQ